MKTSTPLGSTLLGVRQPLGRPTHEPYTSPIISALAELRWPLQPNCLVQSQSISASAWQFSTGRGKAKLQSLEGQEGRETPSLVEFASREAQQQQQPRIPAAGNSERNSAHCGRWPNAHTPTPAQPSLPVERSAAAAVLCFASAAFLGFLPFLLGWAEFSPHNLRLVTSGYEFHPQTPAGMFHGWGGAVMERTCPTSVRTCALP